MINGIELLNTLKEVTDQMHNEGNGEYTIPAWFAQSLYKVLDRNKPIKELDNVSGYSKTLCGELTYECCKTCLNRNMEEGCCDVEVDVVQNLLINNDHIHCGLYSE